MKLAVLCGGVGGSKLVLGLHHEFPHDDLAAIVNTADDLSIVGLHVSPDLDTVMYTLAGLSNPETGWGLKDDSFKALQMLRGYGHDGWFQLGDRDLATHLVRSSDLAAGRPLTQVTARLARALGVARLILPMTDDPVSTSVRTAEGWLTFQEYFVKRRHADEPLEVRHDGIDDAAMTRAVATAIVEADLIIAAPSNPIVSLGPILAVPGMQVALRQTRAPKIAVSPIVGTRSVTGPADALMRAVGHEASVGGLARLYREWLDVLVIHDSDIGAVESIHATGVRAIPTETLMPDLVAKRRLARFVVEAAT